ncbi:MAG: recombinase family protein [Nitriliruptoraceae bacterium]|nr:recombinase family protein [Nitriliruptoraceae bacterium]
MATNTTPRCALYARISEDDLGTEAGVRRQLEDGRALAEGRGWDVVGEYVDNDVSAFHGYSGNGSPRRERPGYLQLLNDADAGGFDRIVCWHTSRVVRDREDRGAIIRRLAAARVSLVAVKGPDLDLASAYGRGMADLLGAFDSMESDVKGERVARAALQRARDGKAAGHVLYGWRRIRERNAAGEVIEWHDEVDPEAAGVVREIVDRLLGGESLSKVRDDLNARGLPTPRHHLALRAGKPAPQGDRSDGHPRWLNSTVRKLAMRPANVAERVHHRVVIGEAAWPAIIDRDKHDQVVALLSNPNRRTSRATASERRHLLTYGVGECGVCGSQLRHVVKRARGKSYPLYVCDREGCVGRSDERVDELVSAVVVERLSRPDAADAFTVELADAAEAQGRAETIRGRLDQAADQYAEGGIDARQLARITDRLRPELDEAEAEYRQILSAAAGGTDVLDGIVGDQAAAAWLSLDVGGRRAVLEVLGIVVKIMPTRQGPGFVPEDVHIEWKGQP